MDALKLKRFFLAPLTLNFKRPLVFKGHVCYAKHSILIRLEFENHTVWWNECSLLPYYSQFTQQDIKTQAKSFLSPLIGETLYFSDKSSRFSLAKLFPQFKNLAPELQLALTALWDGPFSNIKKTNQTILKNGLLNDILQWNQEMPQLLSDYGNVVKIKIGRQKLNLEAKIIKQLLTTYPQLQLRLDANQSLSINELEQFALSLGDHLGQVQYFEEPLTRPEDYQQLSSAIPIGLDESLDPFSVGKWVTKAVKAFVIKPNFWGDMSTVLEARHFANQNGIRCVLSSAYEGPQLMNSLENWAMEFFPKEHHGLDTMKYLDLCNYPTSSFSS